MGEIMNKKKFVLATIGYIIVTFVIAAGWHLVLFKVVYDELGIFTRNEPIFALGFLSMIFQGIVLAFIYPRCYKGDRPVIEGLKFGLLMGIFMGSYAVLAVGAKQRVSSLSTWIILESIYFLLQFGVVGIVIGLIYGKDSSLKIG